MTLTRFFVYNNRMRKFNYVIGDKSSPNIRIPLGDEMIPLVFGYGTMKSAEKKLDKVYSKMSGSWRIYELVEKPTDQQKYDDYTREKAGKCGSW